MNVIIKPENSSSHGIPDTCSGEMSDSDNPNIDVVTQ